MSWTASTDGFFPLPPGACTPLYTYTYTYVQLDQAVSSPSLRETHSISLYAYMVICPYELHEFCFELPCVLLVATAKKKKGPLSPDIFQAKIHVKCSSFRDMGPVRPKSGKQDVQTGPGQGRHLPSPSDQKIDRPQPGLTTVSLRDRFWRFQPNRSSPPRGSSAILFASAGTRPPSYPPPP